MNVRISRSEEILPNHVKVSELMEDFVSEFIDLYDKIDKNNVNEILKY
ncbi:MAG: hypothetical protein LBQ59_02575 [Candidatus Peribacteria bacterium]|jgi:hypothetical protein|nr:hypothetical protein [Candidatus Peribacteria bacterium]